MNPFCTPPTIEVSRPRQKDIDAWWTFCTPPTIEVSKPLAQLLAGIAIFCTPPTIEVSKPQSLLIARMNNFCTPPTIEVSKPPSRHGIATSSFAHLQQSRSANLRAGMALLHHLLHTSNNRGQQTKVAHKFIGLLLLHTSNNRGQQTGYSQPFRVHPFVKKSQERFAPQM